MKRFILIILASTFLLSACGQKGPLYLPDTKSSEKAEQGEENAQDAEELEDSGDTEELEGTEESNSES